MFDIGWSEIIVVGFVSSLVLDWKDIPKIIKAGRSAFSYFNKIISEIKYIILNIEKEMNKIIDLDGNEQETYDLTDIMPDIKTSSSQEEYEHDKINVENEYRK